MFEIIHHSQIKYFPPIYSNLTSRGFLQSGLQDLSDHVYEGIHHGRLRELCVCVCARGVLVSDRTASDAGSSEQDLDITAAQSEKQRNSLWGKKKVFCLFDSLKRFVELIGLM